MKILYGEWGSVCDADMKAALKKLGHEVVTFPVFCKDYNHEEGFEKALKELLRSEGELVYTFNYFPIISNVCEEIHIPYACWVYDSPHLTLYSRTVRNSCNRIFLFDRGLYEERRREVPEAGWYYLPLAPHEEPEAARLKSGKVRSKPEAAQSRSEGQLPEQEGMLQDVSFVGSLYTENNFYDQIGYLPEYVKGYLEGVMEAQLRIYGLYFLRQALTEEVCQDFQEYARFDLGDEYEIKDRNLVADVFLSRKLAAVERRRLLSAVTEVAPLSLYTGSPAENLMNELSETGRKNLRLCGTVDYQREMPAVFRTSRINLNISLRTIETGMPLRVLDIMGAGGFLLSNYQEELSAYFKEGEEFACFSDEKDLQEKINYYLLHEEERRQIAENGRKKALQLFAYEKQADNLLKSAIKGRFPAFS